MSRVVFITGPPGSLREEAVERTVRDLKCVCTFSPNRYLRDIQSTHEAFGLYLANNHSHDTLDPIMTDVVEQHIDLAQRIGYSIVVEGFPRSEEQARELPRICKNAPVYLFELVNVTYEQCRARVHEWCGDEENFDERLAAYERTQDQLRTMYTWVAVNEENIWTIPKLVHSGAGTVFPVRNENTDNQTRAVQPCSPLENAITIAQVLCLAQAPNYQSRFPGSHPVSLERAHFSDIATYPYLVSRKVDGVRFLMVIRSGRCWMLRRDMRVWKSAWYASLVHWENTLLDVEIITDAGRDHCLILDVLSARGESTREQPVLRRLYRVHALVTSGDLGHVFSGSASFQKYFNRYDLRCALRLPFPFKTDGIVFTPTSLPYRHGTDRSMFKWKPNERNSVDLLYERDSAQLFVGDRVPFGTLFSTPTWLATHTRAILECRLHFISQDAQLNRWIPVSARTDKGEPNSEWVARRVCKSIMENITLDDLLSMPGVR